MNRVEIVFKRKQSNSKNHCANFCTRFGKGLEAMKFRVTTGGILEVTGSNR